jgi:hypothetical protein
MPIAEYEAVRRDPNRFLVAPGHVDVRTHEIVVVGVRYVVAERLDADGVSPAR